MKRTPLALLNLLHEKTRLIVAIAGVGFAVLLIFMNLGFQGALLATTVTFYEQLDADIFLTSPESLEISSTKAFPRVRLAQIAGVEGIERTMPLYMEYLLWRNPETRISRAMFVFGINPQDPVFGMPEVQTPAAQQALEAPNTVLIDRLSREEFGPQTVDLETEAGRRRVIIGGQYSLGGGFAADGTLIMSDQNFIRFFAPRPFSQINLGLIQVKAGANIEAIATTLRRLLPADVRVMTRREMIQNDLQFWLQTTAIGFIFSLGVIVSFIVGTVIVYQILYTDIRDHMKEYATLKAMGYSGRYLFGIVLQEAVILAVAGFVPGWVVAVGLYRLTREATNLPMIMTVNRLVLVFTLTLIMCSLSGLISVRRAVTADPAEVF
ncbi:ABC transporter permease DevC [Halomicronema sp. CCY15110]|uniref:ABC transporter permease DevC n=1 Tax=Halomicronema sp. CCY15110 TaxID=2767773 RepID=UPI00194FB32F|nr:ABC transporter permease DevC [Halomicronema sp. CCY15110]